MKLTPLLLLGGIVASVGAARAPLPVPAAVPVPEPQPTGYTNPKHTDVPDPQRDTNTKWADWEISAELWEAYLRFTGRYRTEGKSKDKRSAAANEYPDWMPPEWIAASENFGKIGLELKDSTSGASRRRITRIW